MTELIKPKDGAKRGFLWKPISDTKKTASGKPAPVVLFPLKEPKTGRSWKEPVWFASVELQKDGVRLHKLKRHSKHFQEGTAAERFRQVWVVPVQAKALPKNIIVVATDKKGRVFAFGPIVDPTKRVD